MRDMGNVQIPNGAAAKKADYKEQVICDYSGNPFIEALPLICSREEAVDLLAFYPPYNPEERGLDSHYRVHMVQRLFQCFQPLSTHLDLESRVARVIRQGYLSRNPFKPGYAKGFQVGYSLTSNIQGELCCDETFRTTAAGFTVIGVSGMGKTTAVNRILSKIPQVIVHSKYKGVNFSMYQLTWLKLDCPFDGSIKGLCINFFQKVDSLLGTSYYKKFGNGRKTIDFMLSVMSQVTRNMGLGVLIIDEIQHLNGAKSGGDAKMLNFFVTLVNTIGVPVILIGTTKALSVLQSEFRQARRGSGQGDMMWERLKKDENWVLLVDALWDYQWTKVETPLTREMSDALYEESQGIIDIAVKLYAMSQIKAILLGREEVNAKLFKQVAKESLRLVRPMLLALKSGNVRELAKYEDICFVEDDFNTFMSVGQSTAKFDERIKALRKQEREKSKNDIASKKEKAILKLLELNFEAKEAQKAVEAITAKGGEEIEVSEIVVCAIQGLSPKPKTKTVSMKQIRSENDIRFIVDEGRKKKINAYDTLKEKGLIKNPSNGFLEASE